MTLLIDHDEVTTDSIEALFNDAYYETFRDADGDLVKVHPDSRSWGTSTFPQVRWVISWPPGFPSLVA